MIVDLKKAKQEFLKYSENYDLTNRNIERKQQHSLRVMEISQKIATKLNLSEEEKEIATLIGLLHDIARFEQYTRFHTYEDLKSFDHGDYGVEILKKDIRKYVENSEYDEIIKKAIKNHNKFQIEDGLTKKEEMFSKIIRDADKIDILYESVEMFWKGKEEFINNSKLSEKYMSCFNEKKLIKREKEMILQGIDEIISVIAFIFDINYKSSFEIIKEEDYIDKILNRYDFKDETTRKEIERIRKESNEYIKNKVI